MTAAYIRARVERDGLTEDLARIERGETTANAVGIEHTARLAPAHDSASGGESKERSG